MKRARALPVDEPSEWEKAWIDAMLRATLEGLLRERRERAQPPRKDAA